MFRSLRSWLGRWFVLILAAGMAIQVAYFSNEDRQITRCQARYNISVAETTQKRAQIAEQDRDNLTDFVRRVSTAKTQEDFRDALNTYLTTQDSLDKQRSRNPIPTLEARNCQ